MKIIQEDTNFQYCIQTPRRFYYAKNILYPFMNLFYHILLKSIHKITSPKQTIYKYQTTLVLIFKDEAPFLQEWLTYHLTLGIDHFTFIKTILLTIIWKYYPHILNQE